MPPSSQNAGWRSYETRGQPIHAHGQEVTPIGRVTQFTWPGGGIIRHRPVAVEVRQGEHITRLPIRNVTRQIIALFLAGLALGVLALSVMQRRNRLQRRRGKRRSTR